MNIYWNNWDLYISNKKSDFSNNHFHLKDYKIGNLSQKIDVINLTETVKEKDLNFINNVKAYFPKIKINYLTSLNLNEFFLSKADSFIQKEEKIKNIKSVYLKNKITSKDKNKFITKFKIENSPIFSKASRFNNNSWDIDGSSLIKNQGNVISLRENNYNDLEYKIDSSIVLYDNNLLIDKELNILPTLTFTPRNFLEKLKDEKYNEFYYNFNFANENVEKNVKWKFSQEKKSVIYNMNLSEVSSESSNKFFKNNSETYFYEKQKVNNSFYLGKYLYLECDDFDHDEVIIKDNENFLFYKKVSYDNNMAKLQLIQSEKSLINL